MSVSDCILPTDRGTVSSVNSGRGIKNIFPALFLFLTPHWSQFLNQHPWINRTLQRLFFFFISSFHALSCPSAHKHWRSCLGLLSVNMKRPACLSSKGLLQCCNNRCNGHHEPELGWLCLLNHHRRARRQADEGLVVLCSRRTSKDYTWLCVVPWSQLSLNECH